MKTENRNVCRTEIKNKSNKNFCIEILISKKDLAGMNIAEELKKQNIPFHLLEKETIYEDNIDTEIFGNKLQNLESNKNFCPKKSQNKPQTLVHDTQRFFDKKINADFFTQKFSSKKISGPKNSNTDNQNFYVFATEHCSEKPSKTLTIHAPGNWRKAELGGKDNEIAPTSTLFLKQLFKILNEENEKYKSEGKSEFQVSLEATHHGPTINKPCCFIEIGSGKEEWQDKNAARIIANTLSRILKEKIPNATPALAIGGPHYCPNFNKLQLNSKYAIGHIIAQYALPLTQEILTEAINKTQEKIEIVILDWKGCGKSEERQKLIELLEKNNLSVIRTDQIEK